MCRSRLLNDIFILDINILAVYLISHMKEKRTIKIILRINLNDKLNDNNPVHCYQMFF